MSWQDILHQILSESRKRGVEMRNIMKAVNGIRSRLMTVANYTHPQERLKHIVLYKHVLLESCLEKVSVRVRDSCEKKLQTPESRTRPCFN